VTLLEITTGVLGLSIFYEVFVLSRARERYDAGHRDDASFYGLNQTWAIVTAVSVPMLAVTLLFAPTLLVMVRELAVATLVAVVINATVVRLVLLPVAIVLLGRFNWWIPSWLGRRLPRIRFGPSPRPPAVGGVRHRPQ
jgi:uncharacterized membrane protein YdfJ with MMPL/SSD domain